LLPSHPHAGLGKEPERTPPRDWTDIVSRTWSRFNADHIALISAGVAFHILLAIFPALLAFVALYGLVANVSQVPRQLQALAVMFPADVVKLIGDQMIRLTRSETGGLSFALALGVLVSFWSANGATRALLVGMNVAYEQPEKRGYVKLTLTSLTFTIGLFAVAMLTVATLGADAPIRAFLGGQTQLVAYVARWPLLLIAFAGSLSLLYRYGPSRAHARWRWVTWGSGAGTILWALSSAGLSVYVAHFAHYARTYGSFGAIIGLMVWAWLSAMIVLAGAELDSEMENQATNDSTIGAHLPAPLRARRWPTH
jgi:membrane protein